MFFIQSPTEENNAEFSKLANTVVFENINFKIVYVAVRLTLFVVKYLF